MGFPSMGVHPQHLGLLSFARIPRLYEVQVEIAPNNRSVPGTGKAGQIPENLATDVRRQVGAAD